MVTTREPQPHGANRDPHGSGECVYGKPTVVIHVVGGLVAEIDATDARINVVIVDYDVADERNDADRMHQWEGRPVSVEAWRPGGLSPKDANELLRLAETPEAD